MRNFFFLELESLRGISVLLVFFYHLKVILFEQKLFQSGFLGVDIFFVISGYIITYLIILEKKNNNNNFNILSFLERRCRRILPAVLIMILSVLILSKSFLYSNQISQINYHSIFSILFLENFFLVKNNFNYWNGVNDSSFNPLLHMWALSIEIQYYIFISIFFFIFKKTEFFFKFSLAIIFIFIIVNVITSIKFPTISFYYLPFRISEFLIGGIFAFLKINKEIKIKRNISKIIYFFSIFILISILIKVEITKYLDKTFYHPSIETFFLTFFTGLLIFNHSFQSNRVKVFLENKIFSFTGKISYSIYIWHFPIIFFYDYFFVTNVLFDYLIITLLTFFIATISFYFLEKPLRNKNLINEINFLSIIFILFTIIIISIFFSFKSLNKIKIIEDNKNVFLKINKIEKSTNPVIYDSNYFIGEWQYYYQNLKINKSYKNKQNLLFIGNSVGRDYYFSFLNQANVSNNYNLNYFNPNNLNFQIRCMEKFIINFVDCNNSSVKKDHINLFKNSDILFFSSKWSNEDIAVLEKIIPKIKLLNKKIFIINHPPMFKTKKETFYRLTILDQHLKNNKKITIKESNIQNLEEEYFKNKFDDENVQNKNERLKEISLKNNLTLLDAYSNICSNEIKRCIFIHENIKLHYDYLHLTFDGAKFIGKKLLKSFEKF